MLVPGGDADWDCVFVPGKVLVCGEVKAAVQTVDDSSCPAPGMPLRFLTAVRPGDADAGDEQVAIAAYRAESGRGEGTVVVGLDYAPGVWEEDGQIVQLRRRVCCRWRNSSRRSGRCPMICPCDCD